MRGSGASRRVIEELLGRVAIGEWSAFEELYAHTASELFGLAIALTGERDRAEETLEAGYVRIWRGAGSYDAASGTPVKWLRQQIVAAAGGSLVPSEDARPVRPPPRVRRRLKRRLVAENANDVLPSWGSWLRAAAGLAVAATLSFYILSAAPTDSPGLPGRIEADDGSVAFTTLWRETVGVLHLRREGGGPRPGRALELWIVDAEERARSLGVLPEEPDAAIVVPESIENAVIAGTLMITEERPGGSPTGLPTGDVLAIGSVGRMPAISGSKQGDDR